MGQVEQHILYNGSVILEYDPEGHRYTVSEDGSNPLRVPSVTTITSQLDKSGPLVNWAINNTNKVWKEAIQPATTYDEWYLEEVASVAKKASRKLKEEAAAVGTAAHQWLEAYFKGPEQPVLPPEDDPVGRCVRAALDWLGEHSVRPVAVERRIYSRKHRYSGTLDKLAYVEGKLAVLDWKSSKGLYPEYVLQAAAYKAGYEEETGETIRRAYLIHLGKESGTFDSREFNRGELGEAFRAFVGLRRVHEWLNSSSGSLR